MKLNKESIKQVFLISIGIVLIFVGFFNYRLNDENDNIDLSDRKNEINLGDVELVNSKPIVTENISQITSSIVSNDNLKEEGNLENEENNNEISKNIVENNSYEDNKRKEKLETNYFEETRIERDRMYSENLELYQNLLNKPETPVDQKAIAMQEITNITNAKNGIMISENLIKNKGFEDVVILLNNGVASIVVKSYTLNKEQISKIQNVVERELKIDVKNINISNKY